MLGTEEQKATKAPIKDDDDYHAHSRNTGPSRTQAKRQVIRHEQREAAISRGRAGEEWSGERQHVNALTPPATIGTA